SWPSSSQRAGARRRPLPLLAPPSPAAAAAARHRDVAAAAANGGGPRSTVTDVNGTNGELITPPLADNWMLASTEWRDWVTTADEAAATNGGSGSILRTEPYDSDAACHVDAGLSDGEGGGAATDAARLSMAATSSCSAPMRVAFYCVAASFDRRQLEARLREAYGSPAVRKYPDVIHCQLEAGGGGQLGGCSDAFFFDYGVVAIWGLGAEAERQLVRDIALPCAVQPLPEQDQEHDLFRCSYSSNPASGREAVGAAPLAVGAVAAAPYRAEAAYKSSGAASNPEQKLTAGGSTGGTASGRRMARRAAPAAALPVPSPPPAVLPPAAGPFSVLSFPPLIADDTITLHMRDCGDTAPKLAASYALAQSTRLSAYERAVTALVLETRHLPETLAVAGQVDIPSKEIGKLIGKVFVLKRSVNLLGSVMGTPEFFWYAPDHLQTLYGRLTEYVELTGRVELLNSRFAVLQEMLELLRAQEENRYGSYLELIVIWLIAAAVVVGFFELLELMGVIGPQHVIADDTITLHMRDCGDTAPKLAASYALAQSTRLSAYEKAVMAIVTETQHLPETLAEFGEVDIPSKEIGKLIGRVFVLKRSVNLLGSVMGTPEFFWYAPDQLQALYGRLTEYVELAGRVELLNSRFAVLQEMLELLRAQEENRHGSRLELIVIWLIVVEVVLGFFELLDLLGVIGPQHSL
ncbi:Sporulation protein RMD1, partial [Tetrabaena socialis]